MAVGTEVKIPDVGPLAIVIQTGRHMVKVDLMGAEFWIGKDLLEIPGADDE